MSFFVIATISPAHANSPILNGNPNSEFSALLFQLFLLSCIATGEGVALLLRFFLPTRQTFTRTRKYTLYTHTRT